MTKQTTREYIETNFNKEEKKMFDFIINSFPESILIDDGGLENEDILALLALIAKIIGSARTEIDNLTTAHSAEELFNKIKNNELVKPNEELLLLLIEELDIQIFKGLTKDEKLDLLKDDNIKHLVLNSYPLTKDRGTAIAIKNIIDLTINSITDNPLIDIDVENQVQDGQTTIIIKNKDELNKAEIEELIDFSISNNDPAIYPNSNIAILTEDFNNVFHLNANNIMHKLLMQYKPAGIFYNILVEYISHRLITNRYNDPILNPNKQDITSKTINLYEIEPPIVESIEVHLGSATPASNYVITVTNPNEYETLLFYTHNINTQNNPTIVSIKPGETKTVINQFNKHMYQEDFDMEITSYFKGDITKSDDVENTILHSEFIIAPIAPEIGAVNPTSFEIINQNLVALDLIVTEKWKYNDINYLSIEKTILMSQGETRVHNVEGITKDPSINEKLSVSYTLMFKRNEHSISQEITSPTYKTQDLVQTAPTYNNIITFAPHMATNGFFMQGDVPYIKVVNTNNILVNCKVDYNYEDMTTNAKHFFEVNTTINPGTTKDIMLSKNPYIDRPVRMEDFSLIFSHENANANKVTNITNAYTITPRYTDITPVDLILDDLEVISYISGRHDGHYGTIDITATIPNIDTTKIPLAVVFVIEWLDKETFDKLSETTVTAVNYPEQPRVYKRYEIKNPYRKEVWADITAYIDAYQVHSLQPKTARVMVNPNYLDGIQGG